MHLSKVVSSLNAVGVLCGCYASPVTSRSSYALKERHVVPRGWTEIGPAVKSHVINLQFGLKQSNEGAIEQHLLEVSDPNHVRYGQHLSSDEVDNIITPSAETVELVHAWLLDNNITSMTYNTAKDWVSVTLPIGDVENLLRTKYSVFEHNDGTTLVRTPEFSLPVHLHEHIDVVQPTNSFFRTKRPTPSPRAHLAKRSKHLVLGGETFPMSWWEQYGKKKYSQLDGNSTSIATLCNVSFTTLDCIRTLYGTINYKPTAINNSIGITNYLNETSKRSDIGLFLKTFRPEAASVANTFPIVIIDDGDNDQGNYTADQLAAGKNIEGNLDAELAIGISYPTKFMTWNTGGSPPFTPDLSTPTNTNEPYLVWLNYVLSQPSLPQVISTSYGDSEQTVPYSYAKRVCAGMAQLGARGISVLFSSGDAGVGSDGDCFSNTEPSKQMFIPDFPTSCPWITSVGGTAGFQPEVAVSRFGSGAGFSNYFGAPDYQKSTVEAYIASLNGQYDGLYNKSGRGYPDVAAQGNHDAIAYDGQLQTIGGTSASCPTFSAVVSLLNDARLTKGKAPLGFLNPWIYGGAYKALTDITGGSSIGCNGTGFPAQAGWDAVTGWGTPNFEKLVVLALQ